MEKVRLMRKFHGKCLGERCKGCKLMIDVTVGGVRNKKCKAFGVTLTDLSNWSEEHEACKLLHNPGAWNGNTLLDSMTMAQFSLMTGGTERNGKRTGK